MKTIITILTMMILVSCNVDDGINNQIFTMSNTGVFNYAIEQSQNGHFYQVSGTATNSITITNLGYSIAHILYAGVITFTPDSNNTNNIKIDYVIYNDKGGIITIKESSTLKNEVFNIPAEIVFK